MNHRHPALLEVSLKVILNNRKGETLILKAQPGGVFNNKYDLPGGRMNPSEVGNDLIELINREMKEEVGNVKYTLKICPVSISSFVNKSSAKPNRDGVQYILFSAKYLKGDIIISDEHTGYKWQKLNKSNLNRYFHPVLSELIRGYWQWNKRPNLKI